MEAGADGLPLRYGVWTPRGESGFFLEFGPAPAYELSAVLVQQGKWNETLLDTRQAERRVLGVYVPGQPYAVDLSVDKAAEQPVVDLTVRTVANIPGEGGAIRLRESTAGLGVANAVSGLVPVIAGGVTFRRPGPGRRRHGRVPGGRRVVQCKRALAFPIGRQLAAGSRARRLDGRPRRCDSTSGRRFCPTDP